MKDYEVSFKWNGKMYKEIIKTSSSIKARELVRGKYQGCSINSVNAK